MTNDTRAAFEAWYVVNAFDYERNPLGSRECGLQWASWLASRRAALEEAMQACAAEHLEEPQAGTEDIAYDNAVRDCIDAIRALADEGVKP